MFVSFKLSYNRSSVKVTQLAGRSSSDYLTNIDQIIDGDVTIYGNLTISNRVQVRDLHVATNDGTTICGYDLTAILEDSVRRDDLTPKVINGAKTFLGKVTIEELTLADNAIVFGLYRWSDILGYLQQMQSDIELKGPLEFSNRFHVNELQVIGAINKITANEFGNVWLLREGDQVNRNFVYYNFPIKNEL